MTCSLVDWGFATRVAETVGGRGPSAGWVASSATQPAMRVARYSTTRVLCPTRSLPAGEAVTRAEWAMANIATLKGTVAVLEERIDNEPDPPCPIGGFARTMAGRVVGPSSAPS